MREQTQIFVDRLRSGDFQDIDEVLTRDFLDVDDDQLSFIGDVVVKGYANLADEELIICLNVRVKALVPCAICCKKVELAIKLENYYHGEPCQQIRARVFNFTDVLREAILLEIPYVAECGGRCPTREEIKEYLVNPSSKDVPPPLGQQPFADL